MHLNDTGIHEGRRSPITGIAAGKMLSAASGVRSLSSQLPEGLRREYGSGSPNLKGKESTASYTSSKIE